MGDKVCWLPTDWVFQFVQPLVPSVSVIHPCQISVNQHFNMFYKGEKIKNKTFSVTVAAFKYLSCKWRRPQPAPIFEFICRHMLLRFDILPISALYFRKVFGRWFTAWPCVTYKDDMRRYTGRLAGLNADKNTMKPKLKSKVGKKKTTGLPPQSLPAVL